MLVDMSASTVRVRLAPDIELPERQRTYVVVVHRQPPLFLLTERVEGESRARHGALRPRHPRD
jgi:hypothetical protein